MKSRGFSLSSNPILYPAEMPLVDLPLGLNDAEKKKIGVNLTFALAVCLDQYLTENLDKKNSFAIFCLCEGEP